MKNVSEKKSNEKVEAAQIGISFAGALAYGTSFPTNGCAFCQKSGFRNCTVYCN